MTDTKTCTNEDCQKKFLITEQENRFYQQKQLPAPDFCPRCRHKQRMALRSERELYKRTCDNCQASVLSTIPDSAPYKIYCQKCFWDNIG